MLGGGGVEVAPLAASGAGVLFVLLDVGLVPGCRRLSRGRGQGSADSGGRCWTLQSPSSQWAVRIPQTPYSQRIPSREHREPCSGITSGHSTGRWIHSHVSGPRCSGIEALAQALPQVQSRASVRQVRTSELSHNWSGRQLVVVTDCPFDTATWCAEQAAKSTNRGNNRRFKGRAYREIAEATSCAR